MVAHDLWHGIELFNRGRFFDAHEVLEDLWRAAPTEQKKFFQGLVQVAVAFHHHSTGNLIGMQSVLDRAARNLAPAPEAFAGIDLKGLLESLSCWQDALDQRTPLPPTLPQIKPIASGA